MLALRPFDCRGRSRQVSSSALARQASEERWSHISILSPVPKKAHHPPSFMRSASPSPPSSASMSPDYYDSPPSPPRSLEDQVHVAYALDDIHLAKILLLRLKGIDVTSDDDPRIAAVQDEDFDFCFVPQGGLMDERDEKAVQEMQAREVERMEERRRDDRLRLCERKWEDEKRRLREERLVVLKRRERKRLEEEDRRQQEHDNRRTLDRAQKRKIVSFSHLCPPQTQPQPQFVYDFPFTPRTPPLVPSRPAPPPHTYDDASSVSFTDVLKSMHGPLFPPDDRSLPCHTNRLLDALLLHIEYTDEERRKRKGKQRAQPTLSTPVPCLACTTSPPSPACSSIPRTSSWLSFRGSSASSSSTDLTTLSSSPISSPRSSWFSSPRPISCVPDSPSLRHSCHPRSRLVSVAPAESPLTIEPTKPAPISHPGRERSTSTARAAREGAGVLSKFVGLAKGFQNAYVTAALFSVSASYDRVDVVDENRNAQLPHPRPKLKPAGYRVSRVDVAAFLDPTQQLLVARDNSDSDAHTPRYIPLTSPFPPTQDVPRTVLPDPLPYRLFFKPVPSPTRSPFRFHALSELHTMYPADPAPASHAHGQGQGQQGQVSWRIRSVGNPVHLRLKALHNIVWRCGIKWEGVARETALGGGRERVVGVAYEGVGRSGLSRSSSSLSSS